MTALDITSRNQVYLSKLVKSSQVSSVNVFEVAMIRHLEGDDNIHHFAYRHSARALTLASTAGQKLSFPLRNENGTKIIDITKYIH